MVGSSWAAFASVGCGSDAGRFQGSPGGAGGNSGAASGLTAGSSSAHLSAMGAPEVAKLVARGIKDASLPLATELAR